MHEDPEISQRELSARLGVSLVGINYFFLNALLDRGLDKIQNFNKSPNEIGYSYFFNSGRNRRENVIDCPIYQAEKFEYDALKKEANALASELDRAPRESPEVEEA